MLEFFSNLLQKSHVFDISTLLCETKWLINHKNCKTKNHFFFLLKNCSNNRNPLFDEKLLVLLNIQFLRFLSQTQACFMLNLKYGMNFANFEQNNFMGLLIALKFPLVVGQQSTREIELSYMEEYFFLLKFWISLITPESLLLLHIKWKNLDSEVF